MFEADRVYKHLHSANLYTFRGILSTTVGWYFLTATIASACNRDDQLARFQLNIGTKPKEKYLVKRRQ